jgi:hypothetical protein
MSQLGQIKTDSCGPCLSPKEIKKQNEEQIRDLKTSINCLSKNFGYEKETVTVIGWMTVRLIHLLGPLK